MSERDALIRCIVTNPDDDVARLVFADWLEENGEAERAAFIRLQIELERLSAERARLFNDETDWRRCTGISASWCPNCGDCSCREPEYARNDDDCPLHSRTSPHCCAERLADRIEAARERETELFNPDWLPDFHGQQREWYFQTFPEKHVPDRPYSLLVRRGFVEEIRAGTDDFFRYMGVLFKGHPVARVALLDAVALPTRWHGNPVHRVHVNNVPKLQHVPTMYTYFPVGMKHLFRGGEVFGDYGDRLYQSRGEALDDIGQACVAFGREFAGLPAWEPQKAPVPA